MAEEIDFIEDMEKILEEKWQRIETILNAKEYPNAEYVQDQILNYLIPLNKIVKALMNKDKRLWRMTQEAKEGFGLASD